ncbi:hypothetical protein JVU11DRAFT_4328 [Chiua virens]|nr:hypothetical protein JVU11DRAFT_4328 [Chiua virens]
MRTLRNETHESTALFVPLSTVLAQVGRSHNTPRHCIPWNAWGPSGTRMVSRELSETWVCYNYGMKFIQGLRWKNGHVARAYDFNPYAARKDIKMSFDSPIPWTRLAKQSRPGAQSPSFNEGVVTSLPGRVARVSLAHSDDGWDAVMIGEDHILMVQPNYSVYGYMAM